MRIITLSHIDQKHADSQYFSSAQSHDGLFSWVSGLDGYIGIDAQMAGLTANTPSGRHSIYLQHGANDQEVSPELLKAAREFSSAVHELREQRRAEAERRELDAIAAEIKALEAPGARWTEACDGTAVECSMDLCTRMEDGSVRRVHAH